MMDNYDDQVLSFAPDRGWVARFKTDSETWTEPVIGWGILARTFNDGTCQREVVAVVLEDDRYACTIHEYLVGRDGTTYAGLSREGES